MGKTKKIWIREEVRVMEDRQQIQMIHSQWKLWQWEYSLPYKNEKYSIYIDIQFKLKGKMLKALPINPGIKLKGLTSKPYVRTFKMFGELKEKVNIYSKRNMLIYEWEFLLHRLNSYNLISGRLSIWDQNASSPVTSGL